MADYNKWTAGSVRIIGCSSCGQKGGYHASYCPFNPKVQAIARLRQEKAALDMQFIDIWNAISAIKKRLDALERDR